LGFADVRLPTALSFGSEFGPEFSTEVVTLLQGAEQRNSNWVQDRPRGDLRYSVRTLAYLQQLIAFVHARRGEAQAWRFKWHLDYTGVQQFVGLGDGTQTTFQLQKIYDSGVQEDQYVRKITRPVGVGHPIGNTYDSVVLYQNGAVMGGGYAVNYTTGQVVLSSPLPAGVTLTATFEFDWPMRFASATFLTSLQVVIRRMVEDTINVPGPPQYDLLFDQSNVPWYIWVDMLGQIVCASGPPAVPPFHAPPGGPPLYWWGISDETGGQWYMFPDGFGQLAVSGTAPPGAGEDYNVPLPSPLRGPQMRGEDGHTMYTIAADSRGELTVIYTLPPAEIPFDAYGQTESIPIVGVRE